MTGTDTWEEGERYEHYIGRWSRQVAAPFLAWLHVGAGRRWLDVGCGTGALSAEIRLFQDEIESARWFTRDELRRSPENETFRLSRRDSISRRLVDDWIAAG